MKSIFRTDWPFVILLIFLSVFYFWGIRFIPFHPDESTQLYMSSDFKLIFTNPSEMFWHPEFETNSRQQYRLLDAPLTRYLIGFAFFITGNQPLGVDWDWSKSWEENLEGGAYPDTKLLQISRICITSLLPISLLFVYLICKKIGDNTLGLLAVFLVGTQSVILLHGRRAMAEGMLLMGVCFATWTLLKAQDRPWLAGLGMAVAFNAKQSSLALLPVFIIALVWLPQNGKIKIFNLGKNLLIFCLVFVTITFVLNPVFWNKPIQAFHSAIGTRADLTQSQVEDTKSIAPEKYLQTLPQRAFMLVLNLFISPPEHSLVGNLAPTQQSVNDYIDMPGYNLFRGVIWGGIFLTLTLFGFFVAIRKAFLYQGDKKRNLVLLLLASISMAGGLIFAVPLPWIRFSVPLIPFSYIWIAFGITPLISIGRKTKNEKK